MASLCALCWDIDDKVDLMSKDQVKKVRRLLLDLSYRNDLYAVLVEILCGSCGTEDTVTLCLNLAAMSSISSLSESRTVMTMFLYFGSLIPAPWKACKELR